jgi:ABC-2 type transport system permease protein
MTSTASVFAFLVRRTLAGVARRRLARLREPRYLLGAIVGTLYMYFWLGRAILRNVSNPHVLGPRLQASPEALALLLSLAAAALAVNTALFWVFHAGRPVLHVSEADVQFLAPAPLPRQALLQLSLLRTTLAIGASALIIALALGRNFVPQLWQAFVAAFVVLSTMQLHALGLAFWNARQREAPPATRRRMRLATVAVAAVGLAALTWVGIGIYRAMRIIVSIPDAPSAFRALPDGLAAWASGFVPVVLLAPFRALLAPALAPDTRHFLVSLPAALVVLAAHYAWVLRTNARFEEAALEGARRRAARAEKRQSGRLQGLPSEAQRAVVPFALPPQGRPEMAVLWKNLMSRRRSRLRSAAVWWAASTGLVFVASAVFGMAYGTAAGPVLLLLGLVCVVVSGVVSLALPMASRNDFREDLEKAAVLSTWPLSPTRLALAELAAPFVSTVTVAGIILSVGVAAIAGGRVALGWHGLPGGVAAGPVPVQWIAPGLFALVFPLPALAAAVLVVQNAAVLTFPGWFPPGGQRRGIEATGTRLIAFAGTMLLLMIASIPGVLAGSLVAVLAWRILGPWSLVPAMAAASLPVWIEAAAGVALLGRLFARFDVSAESWT